MAFKKYADLKPAEQDAVGRIAKSIPHDFGLKDMPGHRFTILPDGSGVADGRAIFMIWMAKGDSYYPFARAFEDEIRRDLIVRADDTSKPLQLPTFPGKRQWAALKRGKRDRS